MAAPAESAPVRHAASDQGYVKTAVKSNNPALAYTPQSSQAISWHNGVFLALLVAHLIAAIYAPIQDCDEVYNFWEPTHYLTHGYGLQTWELAPAYAIRSWLYISLHAAPIKLFSFLSANKLAAFYFLRVLLATVAAACETRLYSSIATCLNPRLAIIYAFITATSTGSFIATTSYLPSSFAMYTMTLALAAALDRIDKSRTTKVLIWLALGTIIGWPFVALLSVPFLLEDLCGLVFKGSRSERLRHLTHGALGGLAILALEIGVDSFFYRKFTCTPWNIVYYNVFAGPGRGADIYGTEPWHFYFHNLILNFNVWFPLALSALPLLVVYHTIQGKLPSGMTFADGVIITLPSYLWISLMSLQAHKEERFMYPIYPCLAVNAAMSMHALILLASMPSKQNVLGRVPGWIKLATLASGLSVLALLGIWRSLGVATAFGAPLRIYQHLRDEHAVNSPGIQKLSDVNVCIGKEWYRFPSSYHLPSPPSIKQTFRLRYIRSAFHGLLPGSFVEHDPADSWIYAFPGTWLEPKGMNDQNEEDVGKYADIQDCHFLVDLSFESTESNCEEPDYVSQARNRKGDWDVVKCIRFLDQTRTGIVGRLGWMPEWSASIPLLGPLAIRQWGDYCLLQRRT